MEDIEQLRVQALQFATNSAVSHCASTFKATPSDQILATARSYLAFLTGKEDRIAATDSNEALSDPRQDVGVSMHGYSTPQYPVTLSHVTKHGELYNPMHFKTQEDARRWLKHYEPGVVVLIGRRFAVAAI